MSLYDEWLVEKKHARSLELGERLKERRKGQACRNCAFFQRHPYSDKYNYCALKRSKHTPNGLGKTKRLDWCEWWKPEPAEDPK